MSVVDEGASNFEYVVSRVRVRRSRLFSDEEYRNLVRMGTGEIARFMEESTYDREINALGARYDGVDLIEYALNANLARNFDDLLQWAEGGLYDQIARYLRKFDAWNIKTVLRGIYSNAAQSAIESDLIRAGEFDDDLVDALLESESIDAAIDHLTGTLFGPPLRDAYRDYEESDLLVPLENAVDRAYYEHLLTRNVDREDRATVLYIEFLEAEIDLRNVRNALRLARTGTDIPVTEYFIEGGRLFDAAELDQLTNNMDELVNRIRNSIYGEQLAAALDDLEEAESLIGFERALDAALLEYSDHLSHVYPLSVCPVLAYILAKEREIDNIRAIARGREASVPPDEIEEELVIL